MPRKSLACYEFASAHLASGNVLTHQYFWLPQVHFLPLYLYTLR
jgi:hypothetical protein